MTFPRPASVPPFIMGLLLLASGIDGATGGAPAPSPPAPARAAAPASRPVQVELGLKNVRVEPGEHSDQATKPQLISVPPIYPSRLSDAWVERARTRTSAAPFRCPTDPSPKDRGRW